MARPRSADSQNWLPLAERVLFACALRDAWLAHGLSTDPADRPAAESAVTGLYRLIGEPPPRFVWVSSPPAALAAIEGDPRFAPPPLRMAGAPVRAGDWPAASRLATLASDLRQRLDRRARLPDYWRHNWNWAPERMTAARAMPVGEALDAGVHVHQVLGAALDGSLQVSLRDALCGPLRTRLFPADRPRPLTWYGQQDAYWIGPHDARLRAGLTRYHPRDVRRLGLWADLARAAGWWWPGDGVCVLAERPAEVHTEPLPSARHGELRLHHPDRPAVRYADGTELYVLHGTSVPSWVVTDPTVERIRAEPNIEVRRSAIERIGWDAYIEQAELQLVATAPDPGNPGADLHLYHVPRQVWGTPARVLLVVNGSVEPDGRHRRYGLGVPAGIDDPLTAAGWSYGLTGEQYAGLVRRT